MVLEKRLKKMNLNYKIMLEISKTCEGCSLREKCIEEECVLYRIEQIIINNKKKGGTKKCRTI